MLDLNLIKLGASLIMLATNNSEKQIATVTGLYRHAVKGLSADELNEVVIANAGDTFPDDRRYALLSKRNEHKFDDANPEWLHKENFLCAFTAPELMARYKTEYQIKEQSSDCCSYALPCDIINSDVSQRLLTIRERSSNKVVLGPIDMKKDAQDLAAFFAKVSEQQVVCVSASTEDHTHQFGNTSSGVKFNKGNTRTLHIVNQATVDSLSNAIGIPLNPTRFRPNIVLEGFDAWSEFDWIGSSIRFGSLQLKIINKTVRCDGVSVDPLDPGNVLNIPELLIQHFPQHGPFLGVYATIETPGRLSIGDEVSLL